MSGISLCSLLFSLTTNADDIYKGVKGPTNWQLDSRISYSKNQRKVRTTTLNSILKYWDGDKFGLFGFLNLPYKNVDALDNSMGFGDISLGIGPRGRLDDFHLISYTSFILPTGDEESKPTLSNGRLDTKLGLLGTYFTNDRKYEVDSTIEYNFTGENSSGVNPPNETYIGMLGCREITKRLRFATGFTGLIKNNGDYSTNWRSVSRYTISPRLHFEFTIDKGIRNKNIPKSTGIGAYMRSNL